MSRRRHTSLKPKATKVKTKSMFEHVQGSTIRQLTAKDLPTGCSALHDGIPCTFRMTHVGLRVHHAIWAGDDQPNLIFEGYCKTHRPRKVEGVLVELPERIQKEVNGGRSARSRLNRMEKAAFVQVVAEGGALLHYTYRTNMNAKNGSNWMNSVPTLCEKTLKVGIIPTPSEAKDLNVCRKCEAAKSIVPVEKEV